MEAFLEPIKEHVKKGELVLVIGTGLYPNHGFKKLTEDVITAIMKGNEALEGYCKVIMQRQILPQDFLRIFYRYFEDDALMLLEYFRAINPVPIYEYIASLVASKSLYGVISVSIDNMLIASLHKHKLETEKDFLINVPDKNRNIPIISWLSGHLDNIELLESSIVNEGRTLPTATQRDISRIIDGRPLLLLGVGPDDFRWNSIYAELSKSIHKGTTFYWLPAGNEIAVEHIIKLAGKNGHLLSGNAAEIISAILPQEQKKIKGEETQIWEWEENIGTTWLYKYKDDVPLLLELIGTLLSHIMCKGYAMECVQKALELYSSPADSLRLSRVYLSQGSLLFEQGLMEESIESQTNALREAEFAEDESSIGQANFNLGFSFWNGSLPDRAIEHYTQALLYYQKVQNETKVSEILFNLGIIYDATENFEKARECFNEAIPVKQSMKDNLGEASLHFNIGVILMKEGRMEDAESYLKKALSILEEEEDKEGASEIHHHLGMLYQTQLQYPKAREHYTAAYQILKDSNDILGLSFASCNQGHIHTKLKEFEKASLYYKEAIPIYEKMNDLSNLAAVFNNLGFVHYNRKDLKSSEDNFSRAAEIFAGVGDVYGLIRSHINLAGVYTIQEEYESAAECYRANVEMLEQLNNPQELASSLSSLAMIEIRMQSYSDALNHLNKAAKLFEELGKNQEKKEVQRLIVAIEQKQST